MNPLSLFFRGVLMGIADIVPGVSGGTIALISGIYSKLIMSISSLSQLTRLYIWKRLIRGPYMPTLRSLHVPFLFNLGIGILSGIIIFARLMQYLTTNFPIPTWAFFFSLIFLSALSIFQELKKNFITGILLFLGMSFAYFIVSSTPGTENTETSSLAYIFFCGYIAISAMLLPGISGSFILLLLGEYSNILAALNSFNLPVIITFMAGCACGVLSIAKVISWLLKKYETYMLAFLCGIMLGSLLKLWPWKTEIPPLISPTNILTSWSFKISKTEIGLLPQDYQQVTGNSSQLTAAIFSMALAVALSLYLASKRRNL